MVSYYHTSHYNMHVIFTFPRGASLYHFFFFVILSFVFRLVTGNRRRPGGTRRDRHDLFVTPANNRTSLFPCSRFYLVD